MNYQWQAARHHDVEDIVALMVEYYQHEIEAGSFIDGGSEWRGCGAAFC